MQFSLRDYAGEQFPSLQAPLYQNKADCFKNKQTLLFPLIYFCNWLLPLLLGDVALKPWKQEQNTFWRKYISRSTKLKVWNNFNVLENFECKLITSLLYSYDKVVSIENVILVCRVMSCCHVVMSCHVMSWCHCHCRDKG